MYKETDLTNIKCEKCQHPITYEYVSFQGGTCTIGKQHASSYAVKCSKCRKGYTDWILFNISLFPGFPDPDKCPCRELCTYCGYNESSEKCCGRNRNKNAHILRQRHRGIDENGFDDDLYRMCLKCGKWDRICDGSCVKPQAEAEGEPVVKPEAVENPVVEPTVKLVAEPVVKEWVPINKRKYGLFSLDDTMKILLTPLKDYTDEKKNMFAYESREPINKLNLRALEYPFSFIKEDDDIYYAPEKICTGLVEEEPIKPGNFPNNILEYYWIHEGENDGMGDDGAWHLFCKVMSEGGEAYVYYTASCDYTGFDCQGSMRMYISRNAAALIDSLNKPVQKLFLKAKGYCFRKNSD